jgi:peptidoglycan hydrolase-like protein with peptidoglycan-binding domain
VSLESMVMYMESLLGMKGRPNKATQWYANRNGSYFATAAWCNMTITYAAYQSGNYDAVCFGTDYAYTVYHAEKFKAKGQWHTDTAGIRRGDIVFFDWGGSNSISAIDHIGIVTGVDGRNVLTIEGNTDDAVRRRVRTAAEIVGYGRPNYPATARPGPAPVTNDSQVPATYSPPAFPTGLAPNKAKPSAKGLQQALKDAGYLAKSVALADNYGPQTQAAVAAFYKANSHLSNTSYDIAIGPLGWAELHREAYAGGATPSPAPTPTPTPQDDEPAHVYTKVTYGGKTVNTRTKTILTRAATIFGQGFTLTQGSYNKGVSASAGTHDGGGVVDISVSGWDRAKMDRAVQALRKAGMAAWLRTPSDGFSYHIHGVAIGDKEMSSAAKSQIQQWREDRNGLANRAKDPYADPYPAWTNKYR